MEKKCNHESTTKVYNVVLDAPMTVCKDCGARLDKEKPPEA